MNIQKILIAIDDEPGAEKISLAGLQLARQLNAAIALVSVVDTTYLMTEGGVTTGELAEIIKNDLKKSQQLIIDKVFAGYKVFTFVDEGKPSEVILKIAQQWEADLIMLGTHGRSGLSHLLLGSVAEKVIRHSEKPIFIVPCGQ